MRKPTILDVVRAVTEAAKEHRGVRAWWYAPAKQLVLGGARPSQADARAAVEVVIEACPGRQADCDAVANTLARALGVSHVLVRVREQPRDEGLYRLFSRRSE